MPSAATDEASSQTSHKPLIMSDIIQQLPDSVANMIAAGEVIQGPASVVKELVENAVDAGAKSITIIIKDAGRTLIQVIDDGCGMSETDARMAFEKHATSKITRADDLFDLHTMGFRGEALASIAAVAQIDLRTMLRGRNIGTRILINGSEVESQQPEACSPGSNMMVKNLFFNLPARRRFMRKDSVEFTAILKEFERLALVNPNLELTIMHNDKVYHQLLKGTLKQRIVNLFGKTLDKQLLPVHTETSLVSIDGFVSLPEAARKRNPLEFFFVNGRNMRHPAFHKAVMLCYENLIPAEERPNYFINFTVEPSTIDVNIHPTKSEIKFQNESAIWQILTAAVKEALGRFNAVPVIDFDSAADMPDIPAFGSESIGSAPSIDLDTGYNPFAQSSLTGKPKSNPVVMSGVSSSPITSANPLKTVASQWEKLYSDFNVPDGDFPPAPPSDTLPMSDSLADTLPDTMSDTVPSLLTSDKPDPLPAISPSDISASTGAPPPKAGCLQIKNRYIVVPTQTGMMVIDQHRAHILVLYTRYLDMAERSVMSSQRVFFPEVLRLSPSQHPLMESMLTELTSLGFDVSYLGDCSWSINGAPSVLGDSSPSDTLLRMIDMAQDTPDDVGHTLRERMALLMAKAVAVKPSQYLTQEEMEHILSDLLRLPSPTYTPEGQKIISTITAEELGRLFQ